MKKFRFSLETVLDYKQQALDALQVEHGAILAQVKAQEAEIQEMEAAYRHLNGEFARRKLEGISILDAMKYEQYLRSSERQIQEAYQHLDHLHRQEEAKREQVEEKKKETSAEAPKKVDTIITALERHGMAKGGHLLPYSELLPILQADHPHYPMSHDLLDYILMAINNTIRVNEGAGELAELPASLQVDAMFGELWPEMTEGERKLVEEMGLPPLRREGGNGKPNMEPNPAPMGEERNGTTQ